MYDRYMNITRIVDITTKADQESFDVEELVDKQAPHAYHINYRNYGYAKFIIDDKSLAAFEKQLYGIEDSMSRKQLYNIMADMLRQNTLVGARLLDIVKKQLLNEADVGVISYLLTSLIPLIVKTYIPNKLYCQTHHDLFELLLDEFLASGNDAFND